MRFAKNLAFLLIVLFSTSIHADIDKAQPEVLRFGSVAMDIPAVMHQRLKPLTDYLSRTLGIPVQLKLSPDMAAAIQESASNGVDLAYLTPVAYLRAHETGKVKLVVKTVTKGKGSFKLMIVANSQSNINTVRDLENRDFAFGDRAALLQRAVVIGAGLPLEKLYEYQFLGHYDNIARAVLVGDFAAGILKDTMAYKWDGKGLRIIYASPDLPPYNIAASSKLSPALYEKIKAAFLSLDKSNPEHLKIIKALDPKYDGFAETSDAEYDVVRKLVAPFSKAEKR